MRGRPMLTSTMYTALTMARSYGSFHHPLASSFASMSTSRGLVERRSLLERFCPSCVSFAAQRHLYNFLPAWRSASFAFLLASPSSSLALPLASPLSSAALPLAAPATVAACPLASPTVSGIASLTAPAMSSVQCVSRPMQWLRLSTDGTMSSCSPLNSRTRNIRWCCGMLTWSGSLTALLNSLHSGIGDCPVDHLCGILDSLYRTLTRNWGSAEQAGLTGNLLTEHEDDLICMVWVGVV